MPVFHFGSRSIDLPATLDRTQATRDPGAWQSGLHRTVRLDESVVALRVHTNGKEYPGREASAERGAWILIGDIIQTSSEVADSRTLPTTNPASMTAFTHTSIAALDKGTVINIGIASAKHDDKFCGNGGGFQAEHVGGPSIQFTPLTGKHWHGQAGRA